MFVRANLATRFLVSRPNTSGCARLTTLLLHLGGMQASDRSLGVGHDQTESTKSKRLMGNTSKGSSKGKMKRSGKKGKVEMYSWDEHKGHNEKRISHEDSVPRPTPRGGDTEDRPTPTPPSDTPPQQDTTTSPSPTELVNQGTDTPIATEPADTATPTTAAAVPTAATTFLLGNIRPGGIAARTDIDNVFYITNLAYGGVRRLDVTTGTLATVVPNQPFWERGAVNVAYALGVLVVTGGGSVYGWRGAVYVYDAETGTEMAACLPSGDPARYLHGIAVVDDTMAYVTDSQRNVLMRLDINAAINGECIVASIPLTVESTSGAANRTDPFSTNDPNVFLASGT
jgi:hypothetical protein